MNNYFSDAGFFLREASNRIEKKIVKDDILQISINISLGVERILKGILFDINPTYVYIEPKFDNTSQIIYKHKLIVTKGESLSAKVNEDVITFKNSLFRAECFSETTNKNKSLLFKIENFRDILAHCDLSYLDLEDVKMFILRDYYPLLKSYCTELKIPSRHIFNNKHIKLGTISSGLQNDLKQKIVLLFDVHKEKYKMLSGNVGFIKNKEIETKNVLSFDNKFPTECPCCKNTGVLYLEPIKEYDTQAKEEKLIGENIKFFKCRFCKLEINDVKIIDELGFNNVINLKNSKGIVVVDNDNDKE